MRNGLLLSAIMIAAIAVWPVDSSADDRHADYYYPKPVTSETYKSRTATMKEATRRRRIGFVTHVTTSMLQNNPYPPDYSMYAKGSDAEKMIIVALDDDRYGTLYRMRGLLANLTAVARVSPMLRDQHMEDHLTFLDLLKLMGFKQLTVSDGKTYSHQFIVE